MELLWNLCLWTIARCSGWYILERIYGSQTAKLTYFRRSWYMEGNIQRRHGSLYIYLLHVVTFKPQYNFHWKLTHWLYEHHFVLSYCQVICALQQLHAQPCLHNSFGHSVRYQRITNQFEALLGMACRRPNWMHFRYIFLHFYLWTYCQITEGYQKKIRELLIDARRLGIIRFESQVDQGLISEHFVVSTD